MVARVEDSAGLLYRHRNRCRQVIPRDIANLVTAMLQRVVTSGTGQAAQLLGREVAGKTGTTQYSTDAWFVGFTPQVSTSVWVGLPGNPRPMEQYFGTSVYGGTVAAPIWHDYMLHAMAGMPVESFPPPPANFGKRLKPPRKPDTRVPDVVGLKEKDAEARLSDVGFDVATSDVHSSKPRGTVVAQSPAPGRRAREGTTVSLDVSSGRRSGALVPAVVGKPADAARSVLHAAGFSVSVAVEDVTQDDKIGTVLSQSPSGGTRASRGTTVHITVGRSG
jgi:membrane peptidoglycan carboxypeptidase